jgi:hypothetical protein
MGGYANAGVDTTPVKPSASAGGVGGDYQNNMVASPGDAPVGATTQRAK